MSNLNLLDIAKLNNTDDVAGLIEENLNSAPEVAHFPARSVRGSNYYTVTRTGYPTVAFRKANEGITPGKSTFKKNLVECFILGGPIETDAALAGVQQGQSGPTAEMVEASGVMKSALITLGSQIWYGVTADANGFAGIKSLTPNGGALVYDAGGTTPTTASSVYGVKFGFEDACLILGVDGKISMPPFYNQMLKDVNGNKYMGRVSDLGLWAGLQIGNVNCVGRILNLTADSGKTLTDAKLETWLGQWPVGRKPDVLFASRRSLTQLQTSRTVVIAASGVSKVDGSAGTVAPPATFTVDGIPIIPTDSILNTDALE